MAVGRINGVAALTGFYYKKMYGHFAGTKKSGRNNEVAVRRGSTVHALRVCMALTLIERLRAPKLEK